MVAETNTAQSVTTSYSYDPYGTTVQSGSNTGNSQQYTGRENDGTGLYYYRARYYNAAVARFISEDPLRWRSGQANNYAYVAGRPLSFRDPTGLCADPTHNYTVTRDVDCSAANAFALLLTLENTSAPGSPGGNDDITVECLPSLLGSTLGGYTNCITQFVNGDTLTITNVTQPGHLFDPGTVTITVVPTGDNTSTITVVGEGNGDYSLLNEVLGWLFFTRSLANIDALCGP